MNHLHQPFSLYDLNKCLWETEDLTYASGYYRKISGDMSSPYSYIVIATQDGVESNFYFTGYESINAICDMFFDIRNFNKNVRKISDSILYSPMNEYY